MKILIVDDDNTKISQVISVIRSISEDFIVESCYDAVGAQLLLLENKYDLAIVDLVLPIRADSNPEKSGGEHLLKEIQRNKKLKPPSYIIGLSKYWDERSGFSKIWPVLDYSPEVTEWGDSLREYILYIKRSNFVYGSSIITSKLPTVFLEGEIDENVLIETCKVFDISIEGKCQFKSEKSAGAKWVARQVIIWANHLIKDTESKYIKSIGLFDGDSAGKEAIDEINRVIPLDSASSRTFKTFRLGPSYARHLIPLFHKGIKLPVTLEEMLPPKVWSHAKEMGWLEIRKNPDSFLKDPKKWDKFNVTLKEHFVSLGLSNDEALYLNRVSEKNKGDFWNYVFSLPLNEKKDALLGFNSLLNDFFTEMG